MTCLTNASTESIHMEIQDAEWVQLLFQEIEMGNTVTIATLQSNYELVTLSNSKKLFKSQVWQDLKLAGLLVV